MIGVLITYSKFYGKAVPLKPISALAGLPRTEIIATIGKINCLLQPLGHRTNDDSRDTQIECLKAILLPDEKNAHSDYIRRFDKYARYLLSLDESLFFFTRVSCIYALNELIQSDELFEEEKVQYTFDERLPILNYLLICNQRILDFSENSALEEVEKNKIDFFEFNAFNQVAHNQYYINVNPLIKLYKAKYLLNVLLANEKTAEHLKVYFDEKFKLKDITEFFKIFLWSFINMYDENLKTYYLKIHKSEKGAINLIKGFSATSIPKEIDHKNVNTLNLMSIKKNPVFEWEPLNMDDYVSFLILDQKFLLDKIDGLFINDFWFDYMKERSKMNRTDWGNFIGTKFFEPFVDEIFKYSIGNREDYFLKMFAELKLKLNGKEVEVADIYLRHKQQIMLAEVKSNYINMHEGYKSVTSIEEFKKLNLDKFYKSFGLTQLLKKTIKEFHSYKDKLDDKGLNLTRKIHLYPVVIVNEPILSSGLFNFPLRIKFEQLLENANIKMKTKDHLIWPLLIINIEEFQELEESLKDGSADLFKILRNFHDKTRINGQYLSKNYNELLNLTDIINHKIEPIKFFPERLRNYKWVVPNE